MTSFSNRALPLALLTIGLLGCDKPGDTKADKLSPAPAQSNPLMGSVSFETTNSFPSSDKAFAEMANEYTHPMILQLMQDQVLAGALSSWKIQYVPVRDFKNDFAEAAKSVGLSDAQIAATKDTFSPEVAPTCLSFFGSSEEEGKRCITFLFLRAYKSPAMTLAAMLHEAHRLPLSDERITFKGSEDKELMLLTLSQESLRQINTNHSIDGDGTLRIPISENKEYSIPGFKKDLDNVIAMQDEMLRRLSK